MPSCPPTAHQSVQVMQQNVGNFPDAVIPVQAAIVDAKTAAEKDHLTFTGESNQYWGFHVDHGDSKPSETVTFDVATKSLADLRVRSPFEAPRAMAIATAGVHACS